MREAFLSEQFSTPIRVSKRLVCDIEQHVQRKIFLRFPSCRANDESAIARIVLAARASVKRRHHPENIFGHHEEVITTATLRASLQNQQRG
jgi:hypothetical protein